MFKEASNNTVWLEAMRHFLDADEIIASQYGWDGNTRIALRDADRWFYYDIPMATVISWHAGRPRSLIEVLNAIKPLWEFFLLTGESAIPIR